MDPSLADKIAFFKRIEATQNGDENDDLGAEEQEKRLKSQSFHPITSRIASLINVASLNRQYYPDVLRRTASDPNTVTNGNGETILFSTPNEIHYTEPSRLTTNLVSEGNGGEYILTTTPNDNRESSMGFLQDAMDSVIPETTNPLRRTTHPPSSLFRSATTSQAVPSPSAILAKRKRSKPVKKVPEPQQIFKDLRFYYIPNDDVNPARRLRIAKALEYGATWTQNLADATLIVVDENLTYSDIKPILDSDPMSSQKTLVNARYPLECVTRREVFSPKLSIEQGLFGVPGIPQKSKEPDVTHPASHDSNLSLQVKSRRKDLPAPDTPRSTDTSQRSEDIVRSSHPEEVDPPMETLGGDPKKPPSQSASQQRTSQATTHDDALSQCIGEIRVNPALYNELEDDASVASGDDYEDVSDVGNTEDEQPRKKKVSRKGFRSDQKNPGWQEKFKCMKGGTVNSKKENPNAKTMELLEAWKAERELQSDGKWRAHSLRKAIATLRQQPTKVTTAAKARLLPNIGDDIADKIHEIVQTGTLRHLEEALSNPDREVLSVFLNIYDVGQSRAYQWIAKGFRTLDDLKAKAELSANQRVGIEHYDDLLTRIPRAEVEALGSCVKKTAKIIDPKVELIIGGSYRRGADDSGDIDMIITKPGTSTTQDLVPFLNRLVDTLTGEGFLTVALAAHRDGSSIGSSKWHGCCVLPDSAFPGAKEDYRPVWRRIDLLLVPETEMGAALIYFTGNDLFNRSLRLLARKKGLRLNQRVLSGLGVSEGRDERKIFELLGVHWREPHERWC
ncbi:Uu.00g048760.m01.CDS01 [Anthostomella pinea]|uniref:DNA-directed DNA polymerase n=1 Tax=Anthostomella pinea TaxID=933095 RepID=A0AAI8YEV2_9PEZI|nr:Uu.00g048760.m01.CDS01 [Anthostomella pinea]